MKSVLASRAFRGACGLLKCEGSVDFHAEAEAAFDKDYRFILCESQLRCATACGILGPVQLLAVAESVLPCAPPVPGSAGTCVSVLGALPTAAVNVPMCRMAMLSQGWSRSGP